MDHAQNQGSPCRTHPAKKEEEKFRANMSPRSVLRKRMLTSVNHPGAPHTPEEETETRAKPTVAPPKGHPTQNIEEEFGSVEQVGSGNPQHPTKMRKETLQTKQ